MNPVSPSRWLRPLVLGAVLAAGSTGCAYASSHLVQVGPPHEATEGACTPTFFEAAPDDAEVETVATDDVSCSDAVECVDRLRQDACRVGATRVYVARRNADDPTHMSATLTRPREAPPAEASSSVVP